MHSIFGKYGGLSLYDIDIKKRWSLSLWYWYEVLMYNFTIRLVKGNVYDLIGNPDHPDLTSIYH